MMGGRKHLEIAVPKHRNSTLRKKTKNLLSQIIIIIINYKLKPFLTFLIVQRSEKLKECLCL